ncbi:MAG: hypothetical protein M3063_05195 [Actinomycetota bacterium]|nr:hypothetical protein [Actinomycetota bacterium]
MASEAYDAITGCGSVDPTDPANYTSARLVNNVGTEVVVDNCIGAYCYSSQELPEILSRGDSVEVQGSCGASGADMTSWRVSHAGAVLGFVAIRTPRSRTGVVYLVSRLSPNRATPTQPVVDGTLSR